jgi:hypothetical protein
LNEGPQRRNREGGEVRKGYGRKERRDKRTEKLEERSRIRSNVRDSTEP